jgi:hypothetical protein
VSDGVNESEPHGLHLWEEAPGNFPLALPPLLWLVASQLPQTTVDVAVSIGVVPQMM